MSVDLPADLLTDGSNQGPGVPAILDACCRAGHAEAAILCLALRQGLADGRIELADEGWAILVQDDFPREMDLGRQAAIATAAIEAICRAEGLQLDYLTKARWAAMTLQPMTGLISLRTPLTAWCTPADAGLMQMRFQPQTLCEAFDLPPGVTLASLQIALDRPTTRQRLVDTWICAEMGRRIISELRDQQGQPGDPMGTRLAAITPAEFVEQFRNDLPTRILGKTYLARFGGLRGINGELDPDQDYKVRSRAEHHIYENRRVHDFATWLVRSQRTPEKPALIQAGELMYASHWSHGQRCGIGGIEADWVVNAIRERGPDAGLFGAKVTGGGAGGEIVVLMRDDQTAVDALHAAIHAAEAKTGKPVRAAFGRLAGASFLSVPPPAPTPS